MFYRFQIFKNSSEHFKVQFLILISNTMATNVILWILYSNTLTLSTKRVIIVLSVPFCPGKSLNFSRIVEQRFFSFFFQALRRKPRIDREIKIEIRQIKNASA